ncbi:MAG: hypothetical protein IT297_06970 [Anaerolineae bacterium]|nr:hypothetical protein [Anaerolineae bacterium]
MFYVYILHSGGRRRSTARLLSDYSRTGAFCQVMNVILCAAGAGRGRGRPPGSGALRERAAGVGLAGV